jgi:hypothetical protein
MSLLQRESQETAGESYTKGSSYVLIASIIATVLVSIAIAAYIFLGEKPPAATGDIVEVWTHPMHTESSGFDASGAVIPKEVTDRLLLFTHVRLHNQSKQPIFLHQVLANATMPDGSVDSAYAATTTDYERLFTAYPQMAPWHATPISPDLTIQPGETKEGTFVVPFQMKKPEWDTHKGLDYTFNFQYLPALKVTPTVPITER